jgi:hypothetical protein
MVAWHRSKVFGTFVHGRRDRLAPRPPSRHVMHITCPGGSSLVSLRADDQSTRERTCTSALRIGSSLKQSALCSAYLSVGAASCNGRHHHGHAHPMYVRISIPRMRRTTRPRGRGCVPQESTSERTLVHDRRHPPHSITLLARRIGSTALAFFFPAQVCLLSSRQTRLRA